MTARRLCLLSIFPLSLLVAACGPFSGARDAQVDLVVENAGPSTITPDVRINGSRQIPFHPVRAGYSGFYRIGLVPADVTVSTPGAVPPFVRYTIGRDYPPDTTRILVILR